MNTAIRAVVRTSIYNGLEVYGIYRGWRGLIDGEIQRLHLHSVSNIISRGGTILHTVRCPEFKQEENIKMAMANLKLHGIQALVVIGGDGSLQAAYHVFIKKYNFPVVNIPASIDNDIPGTEFTIGYDTAVNTAVEAIDKIRDTASSHERLFIIEVMGRESGSIAIDVGLVCGAEAIIIPEVKHSIADICNNIMKGKKRGKNSFIIVLAEGADSASKLAPIIKKRTGLDVRVSVLGHMQRGGSPTALSREYACKMGHHAVELLLQNKAGRMVGMAGEKAFSTPIEKVLKMNRKIDASSYKIAQVLST